jgi:hypothetical protein
MDVLSARRVGLVLLCEDSQHEAFACRFLKGMNWDTRGMRVVKSPNARGAAAQWVRSKFPDELQAYRSRRTRAITALIAIIDADVRSVQARIDELSAECTARQIPFRTRGDAVAIVAPKRSIETWITHLRGGAVDETSTYRKLDYESECRDAVDVLLQQCRGAGLRNDAPPSLVAACGEYNDRIRPVRA